MILFNTFQLDSLTWDTIEQFLPLLALVLLAYGILWILFFLLPRPRTANYEAYNHYIRRPHWSFAAKRRIRHIGLKRRSSGPYVAHNQRSATSPESERAIRFVGADIDRFCNRAQPVDYRDSYDRLYGEYFLSRKQR